MSPIYLRRPLSMLLAGSVLAIVVPGAATAASANTMTLSAASVEAWAHPRVPTAYVIPAGHAPVRVALARIVPEPYTIEVARSVPENMVIVWQAGDDWMKVLRKALKPMGLSVNADWNHNIIRVSGGGDSDFGLHDGERMANVQAAPVQAAANKIADQSGAAWPAPARLGGSHGEVYGRVYIKGGNNTKPVLVSAPFAGGLAPHAAPKSSVPKAPFGSVVYTIKAGTMLSTGLTKYVDGFGWSIRWKLADDYRLDAPFPIPVGSLEHGLRYVFKAYQAQGGLLGDGFVLNEPNKVAVIHKLSMPSIPGEGN